MQLRTKIILLVVPLMLLPVAFLVTLASRYLDDNLRREHVERLTAFSAQVQDAADLRELQATTTLKLFAENPILQSFMLDDGPTRYSVYEKPLLRFARSVLRAYSAIGDLQVVMPDGTVDFTVVNGLAVGAGGAGYFDRLRASPGFLNQLLIFEEDKAVQIYAMPMYLKNDVTDPLGTVASFQGYLVLKLDVPAMYGPALAAPGDGASMMLLHGESGRQIAGQPGISERLSPEVMEMLMRKASREMSPAPQTLADGTLVVIRKLSGDIYLLGLHSDERLVNSLAQLERMSWVSSMFIILLMLIALVLGLNRLLLRRLRYLDGQIRLAKAGQEVGAPESVTGNDELSELTRLFLQTQHQLSEITQNMAAMAFSDDLTGLPNKASLQQSVEKALALAKRHNELLAVMFLDLDNFKNVNDALGHEAGDQLLRVVAERLQSCVRGYDVVACSTRYRNPLRREVDSESMLARMGGDEFSILLNEVQSPAACTQIAERIISVLGQPIIVEGGHEVFVGTSIGISLFPHDGNTPSSLLKHADIAMYRAKSAGKNTFQFFDSSMNEVAAERLEMEARMRSGLSAREFELHYQPKLHLRANSPIHEFEALLRWRHPDKGFIGPEKFIPIAESNGFIRNIGDWVLCEVARQIREWNDKGFPKTRIAVNLSPVQVSYGSPLEGLLKALGKYGILADQIEIEITESGLMQNEDQAIELLNSFREMGVRIALDDFGTGYSSLSYLRKLPIDTLKVDRSFVRDLVDDKESEAVLASIVQLAGKLQLMVVAEGVETEEQIDILRRLGVDQVQGYYYAKPMPADEARAHAEQFLAGREGVLDARSEAQR